MDWWLQLVLPSVSTISNSFSILHQVPEGHVGVYWRGGALLKTITDPGNLHWTFSHLLAYGFNLACFSLFYNSGFHLKLPLITQYEPVQVTLQTDQVIFWSNLWRLRILSLHSFTLNFGIFFAGEGHSLWYKRGCHDQLWEDWGTTLWVITPLIFQDITQLRFCNVQIFIIYIHWLVFFFFPGCKQAA